MMGRETLERDRAARNLIDRTMQRVEKLVDFETEALRKRAAIDLKQTNNSKSQALLELGMAARAIEGTELEPELVDRLRSLRAKLEENRAMLNRHLEAVREVAGVIAETIKDGEWDGTYSQCDAAGGIGR